MDVHLWTKGQPGRHLTQCAARTAISNPKTLRMIVNEVLLWSRLVLFQYACDLDRPGLYGHWRLLRHETRAQWVGITKQTWATGAPLAMGRACTRMQAPALASRGNSAGLRPVHLA